jgi:TolB protein
VSHPGHHVAGDGFPAAPARSATDDRRRRERQAHSVSRIVTALIAAAGALALTAPATPAAVPGANGRIAFTRTGVGIVSMAPDGSRPAPLLTGPLAPWSADPAWSPDGSLLAYTATGRTDWVWLVNADGSAPRALAEGLQPAWSPDGRRLAFARVIVRRQRRIDVWIMNADGTGAVNLTGPGKPAGSTSKDLHPAWSPDGSRIAFSSDRGANRDVYAVAPDGGAATPLTDDAAPDSLPHWSPDGRSIAFTRGALPARTLWVMAADGSGERRMWPGTIDESSPVFAPDGTRLAFVASVPGRDGLPASRVLTAALDGSGRRDLGGDDDLSPAMRIDWAAVPRRGVPQAPAGTARRLAVSRAPVRASRSGRVRLRVACPPGRRTCAGRLRLLAARRVSCRRGSLRAGERLGAGAYVVPSGAASHVAVRLSRRARRALACARRVRARAVATADDRAGGTSSARVVVRAPRARGSR